MKKTLLILTTGLVAAGSAHAALITFNSFSNDAIGTGTATANESTAGLVVTRSTIAVGGVDQYLFAVSYTGSDFDGDTVNDTLTFNMRVSAMGANTVGGTEPAAEGQNYSGSVALDGVAANVFSNGSSFTVGNTLFSGGQTLIYSIEDISLNSLAGYQAVLNGFDQYRINEIGTSNSHQTVTGVGSDLFLADTNGSRTILLNGTVDEGGTAGYQDTLYVTARSPDGGGGNPQRMGILNVGFDITVDVIPEPSSAALLGLGALGLLLRRKRC
ncbi:PEP-CTERM sorting domain-containing protein [Luteolibacter sp. AS25]|uniref:PEP-CTERM sorting domain-containing protein n=1 Tax=Luteolibacter sp. AS25 TaxID=3135776 RepID=UPI00398B3F5C